MTVKQLIEQLKQYPDNMDVFLAERKTDEFEFGLLNSVYDKEITFVDGLGWPEYDEAPKVKCVILDEE